MDIRVKLLAAAVFAVSFAAFADSATVVSATGKVEVNRDNVWIPVEKDAEIQSGELVSTGFKSEVILKYKGAMMKLGPLTRITIERMASTEKKDDVSVYLKTGVIKSTVSHTENKRVSYTVRNPVAVASVRGTDFDFYGSSAIVCNEGGIVVAPAVMWDAIAAKDAVPAEGESNVFTKASDLNPSLSRGVVLVAGQDTGFDPSSFMPERPQNLGIRKQSKFSEGIQSVAVRESEVTGGASAGSVVTQAGQNDVPTAKKAIVVVTGSF